MKQNKLILLIAVISLFLGRSWQHLIWDAPFRTLLWNEELLKPLVESLTSMTWHQYVTNPNTDSWIQMLIKAFGLLYATVIFSIPWGIKRKKWALNLLLVGNIALLFLIILIWAEKFFYFGMLFEHMLQLATPLVAYLLWSKGELMTPITHKKVLLILKGATALTFIGHGLFAIGFYPVPGHFIDMLINVFGCTEDSARNFLKFIGTVDILAAFSIFYRATMKYGLVFMVFWGLITAFARVTAHVDFQLLSLTSQQWIYETLVRLPHGLIPLFLLNRLKKI